MHERTTSSLHDVEDPAKRRLLKLVGLSALALAIPADLRVTAPEITIPRILREFVTKKGDNEVTFEEARKITPLVAEAFYQRYKLPIPKDQLVAQTYFFRADVDNMEEWHKELRKLFDRMGPITSNDPGYVAERREMFRRWDKDNPHPISEQFKRDYPNVKLDPEIEREMSYRSDGGGFAHFSGVYVGVEKFRERSYTEDWYKMGAAQASEFAPTVDCQRATPATFFLTALTHEWIHRQPMKVGQLLPLTPEWVAAKRRSSFRQGYYLERIKDGQKLGFGMRFIREDEDEINATGVITQSFIGGLEEQVASYIPAKFLHSLGLPFFVGFRPDQPVRTLWSFEQVLKQAGVYHPGQRVPEQGLVDLHSDNKLDELLLKLADSALNTSFDTPEARYDFAFNLFDSFDNGVFLFSFGTPRWQVVYKPHFPDVIEPEDKIVSTTGRLSNRSDIGCRNYDEIYPNV
ncbi:hypothetical protein A3B49_00175 [Candidatus Daviesbacteria bacterium RIFCSPLOWO2_01_FULL_40_24]|uniref:Uncharacterized protein n=1 Tax=Candidatus Daviesbacteria bacterium RIFCSPLOWO2_01_FULL_40_24 TaxID=1797787 RepID=A0A1F5MIP1_9BACT|nr:MAG: hypothetical protein A3B49_00175 [Candidatus Daviesbacteria bacterium RIFCSPLOWO2_01_FULL_40_24]